MTPPRKRLSPIEFEKAVDLYVALLQDGPVKPERPYIDAHHWWIDVDDMRRAFEQAKKTHESR